jgi:hypothetical protein
MKIKKLLYVFSLTAIMILPIGCADTKGQETPKSAFNDEPTKAYCEAYVEFDDAVAQLSDAQQLEELQKLSKISPNSIKPNYARLIKAYKQFLNDEKPNTSETTLSEDSKTLARYSVQKCDMFKRESAL